MTRHRWRGVLLLVALLGAVYVALAGAKMWSAFLPGSDQARASPPFATRPSCTPVLDDWNPPVYPNAEQVAVIPAATPQWLGVLKTIAFQTADSPAQVIAFYQTTMIRDGWSADSQLTAVLKTPVSDSPPTLAAGELTAPPWTPTWRLPDPYPNVVEALGFAAWCGTASAHPPRVYVVIYTPDHGRTPVELQVH